MKIYFILSVLFTVSLLLVFVAPHHRRQTNSFKACTLSEIYGESLRTIPSAVGSRDAHWLAMLILVGMLASAFPMLFITLVHWAPPISGRGWVYVLVGLLIALIWIIPAFQSLFGIASIVAGTSTWFAFKLTGWFD
jgi:hypothetical protein